MRRRLAEAVVTVVVAGLGLLGACSSDDEPGAPAARAGSAGNDGGADSADGGTGGSASRPSAGQGSGGEDPGSAGGGPSGAGMGPGGAPSEGGAAGALEPGSGGEGGAPTEGPPDVIETSGGPWPDSLTSNCATPAALIPCPQLAHRFFGQDGNYRINVPSYSVTAGVMTDSITGLSWQLTPESKDETQAAALAYCEALSLGGHDDWRLPSRLEYVSVLDAGLPNGFAMPPLVSGDTTGQQWTSSATGTTAQAFFVLDDEQGTLNIALSDTAYGARCVRGAPLTGALVVGADTVTDGMTALEWQRTALDDTTKTWEDALSYCEELSHAQESDWRLPSLKELATLVDETAATAPAVDAAAFGASTAERYWSSTPASTFGSERVAFVLDTDFGGTETSKMIELAAARCVRTAD